MNFLHRFSENNQKSNFVIIRPVGAELFYADRQTDGQIEMTKIIVAFRNFVIAHKNVANFFVGEIFIGVL